MVKSIFLRTSVRVTVQNYFDCAGKVFESKKNENFNNM